MTPPLGGNGTEGGNMSMEQVLALLTATCSQMGGTLAHAEKSNVSIKYKMGQVSMA